MKKQNVSVKEIARLAGTSTATVSRVLNQNGRFSRETEEKVLKAIKETGYEINPLARGLRATHSNIIGILVPDMAYEFYSAIAKEIQDTLLEHGYLALVCNTDEKLEQARQFVRLFRNYNADGIIYIGDNELTELPDLPIVYVDRDPRDMEGRGNENYTMVECDNIQGGYLAGRELIKNGCRRIVYIANNVHVTNHRKRLQGLRSALEEEGIELKESCIYDAEGFYMEEGFAAAESALTDHPDTDGIFCTSDPLAFGCLNYLTKNGISVPDQIKLVGFDDHSMSSAMDLTTIRQPVREMGRTAAIRIMDMIAGKEIAPKRVRLPVELVERGTAGHNLCPEVVIIHKNRIR